MTREEAMAYAISKNKVVCLRCGLESPWVPRSKGKNGVKKAWNAMILEKRKGQTNG